MKVTQKMIAEQLNVSVSTVSRALANNPAISLAERRRVQQMARRLGYHARRSKATRRLTTIGVVVHGAQTAGPNGAAVQAMLMGITEGAAIHNVSVPVQFVAGDNNDLIIDSLRAWPPLRSRQLAGLITLYAPSVDFVDEISMAGPMVVLGSPCLCADFDRVVPESPAGMGQLVSHLHELAHRRIGFVGDGRGDGWSCDRWAGFARAMMTAGLDVDPGRVVNISGDVLRGGALADRLRELIKAGTTALVCADDSTAQDVGRLLTNAGVSIPDDVSVTGFGSKVEFDGLTLTGVSIPWRQLGRTALERVRERVDKTGIPAAQIAYPGRLVVGATTTVAGK
jgi:LacI family transcriptional regulator